MVLNKLARYYHTLKHLTPRQGIRRGTRWLQAHLAEPARSARKPQPPTNQTPPPDCVWPQDMKTLSPTAEPPHTGTFTFLNQSRHLGWPPDWNTNTGSRLWRYQLHYLEWLWELSYQDARNILTDWVQHHPPGRGQLGWDPYPVSVRVMTLCALFFGHYRQNTEADASFQPVLTGTITQQCQWLNRRLETHLLANHYLENGAALALAGSCFDNPTATQWLATGLRILKEQLAEQIPDDGVHFELSPMYHTRIIYVLALLAATREPRLLAIVTEPLRRMLRALEPLCHPDGNIALLNDSALGVYPSPDNLKKYCNAIGIPGLTDDLPDSPADTETALHRAFQLPRAGYYGWQGDTGDYIICDAGPIGPDYNPGHGHADIFNFELSLKGHRVIVDAGVHDYHTGPMRQYCRSTAAHNTVEINGRNQSDCWAAFRVGRRATPRDITFHSHPRGFRLSGWHDGYTHPPARATHHRRFEWQTDNQLRITDTITARQSVQAVSRIHLHPDCSILSINDRCVTIDSPGGRFSLIYGNTGQITTETTTYCPQFHIQQPNQCLLCSAEGDNIQVETTIDFHENSQDPSP